MQGFLIWGAFSAVVSVFCVARPQAARVFVGVFFAAMGMGIHGILITTDPHAYVEFANAAPWGIYRDTGLALTEPSPVAFGIFMLVFEAVIAVLILGRGRQVTWGLVAAIMFLLGITPLGLEEVPNLVLAAGLGYLLTQEFPIDAWTGMSRHLRRSRPTAPRPHARAR